MGIQSGYRQDTGRIQGGYSGGGGGGGGGGVGGGDNDLNSVR